MIKPFHLGVLLVLAAALVGATTANASATTATNVAHATALVVSASSTAYVGHHGFGHRGFYGGFGHRGFYGGFGHRGHYGGYGYYGPYSYGHYRYGHRAYRYGYAGRPRYGYPYGYGGNAGGDGARYGAIDVNIKPSKAEVYVDGRYVGVADQYDGFPSYLWLEEGVHKLVFYREGFETVMREIAVQPDLSVDVRMRLVKGTATAPEEIVPPPAEPLPVEGSAAETGADGPGRLMVSIEPDDAVIYIDGHFFGVAGELRHVRSGLPIEAGEHTVEILRPGYRAFEQTIRVEAGESITLDAVLRPR